MDMQQLAVTKFAQSHDLEPDIVNGKPATPELQLQTLKPRLPA